MQATAAARAAERPSAAPSGSDSNNPSSISTAATYSSTGVPSPYYPREPTSIAYPPNTYPSPRSTEGQVHRQNSLPGWSAITHHVRRLTDPDPTIGPTTSQLGDAPDRPPRLPAIEPVEDGSFHFDTMDPFDSTYSLHPSIATTQTALPLPIAESTSHVPLVPPLPEIVVPDPTLDRRITSEGRQGNWFDPGTFDDEEEEAELRAGRTRSRMLSFQDFLAGVPDHEPHPKGRSRSRRGSRRGSLGGR